MSVQFQDYYATLSVPRTASAEDIKQAFRKLARLHHPDVAKDKQKGEARFKEINEAYEVLGDPEKRRQYDELGAEWQAGTAGKTGQHPSGRSRPTADAADFEFSGTGFSDFFESFFSSRQGGFSGQAPPESPRHFGGIPFPPPNQDVEADLLVTLEEALKGALRKITLTRPAPRSATPRTDTYEVRIPAGVHEGQRIRLAGQGEPAEDGGAPGDLYLRVRLERHPDFNVQGGDLYCDLDLAPWEAVLGIKAKIPTLDGTTVVRIAPGTAAGRQLRLRGLGLPAANHQRGDLYATVRIKTPTRLTAEEQALWEQLARLSTFNPRSES